VLDETNQPLNRHVKNQINEMFKVLKKDIQVRIQVGNLFVLSNT